MIDNHHDPWCRRRMQWFPLYAISKPSWRRGPGLVEAEVGVLSFCHSMPLCAKSECCDDLGGFPLHRRAWNSVTIKQGLAATGDYEILAGTGLACRSISSVFPARWLGRLDRSRVCQAGFARSPREIEMRSQGSSLRLRPCARVRPECHTWPRRLDRRWQLKPESPNGQLA